MTDDKRERNNTASNKSYRLKQIARWAVEFERIVVQLHAKRLNTEAFHWTRVPEEWLYEAGYITDYNRYRLARLIALREKQRQKGQKNKEGCLKDYGMDGMARWMNELGQWVYDGLQAKNYDSTNKITAAHIGTFLAVQMSLMLRSPQSKGYLYTTSELQPDLRDLVANPNYPIKHILHPWQRPDKRCEPQKAAIERKECDLPLRDYQKDAIALFADQDGINSLVLPCRMGKTVIAGHVLKKKAPSLIIAIAPLKASVENLQERLPSFLSGYTELLVDSDAGGTTDPESVKAFLLQPNQPHIIYTTYESAMNVVRPILEANPDLLAGAYVLTDEVHNANEAECEFINTFPRGLTMTATFPEELGELLDIQETYQMPFQDAIQGGWICDYTMWLPCAWKDGHEQDFAEYGDDVKAKVHFLATTMLAQGCRRTIVYLTSKKECEEFQVMAEQEFTDYFGVPVWTGTMTSDTPKKERKEVLHTFQNNDDTVFSILTSIKILDEAVDIPKCDSEFMTNISDRSSFIRFVQRMMRGGTKDPENPSKHNHVLVWANGWKSCIDALEYLRTSDPEFHKKIRYATRDYDQQGEAVVRDAVKERNQAMGESVRRWEEMQGMKFEDMFVQRVKEIDAFHTANGKWPSHGSKDINEKQMAKWMNGWRVKKNKGLLSNKRIILLDNIGFVWNAVDNWSSKFNKLLAFYKVNQKWPNSRSKEREEKSLGAWMGNQRQAREQGKLSDCHIHELDSIGFVWSVFKVQEWSTQFNKLMVFYKKHGKWPISGTKDKEEKQLASWMTTQRSAKRNGRLSHERIKILDEAMFEWDILEDWTTKFNKIVAFYNLNKRWPNSRSKEREEKSLGLWIGRQRSAKKKGKLSSEHIQLLNNIGITWECIEDWLDRFNDLAAFYKKNGRWPSMTANDREEKSLGKYIDTQRQKKKKNTLSDEYIEKLNSIGFIWMERTNKEDWFTKFNKLCTFYNINGKWPLRSSKNNEEKTLSSWINNQRAKRKKNKLSTEHIATLDTIGFEWELRKSKDT